MPKYAGYAVSTRSALGIRYIPSGEGMLPAPWAYAICCRQDIAYAAWTRHVLGWLDAMVAGMVAALIHASNFAPHTLSSPPTYGGMRTHGFRAMHTHASLCRRMRFRVASGGMLAGVLTCAIRLDSPGLQPPTQLCAMGYSYICAPRHLSQTSLLRELIRLSCSVIRLFCMPLFPYS
jgi:hypothetical protein